VSEWRGKAKKKKKPNIENMSHRYDDYRERGYGGGGGNDRHQDRGYGDRGYGGRHGGGGDRFRGGDRRRGGNNEQSGGGAEHLARIHGTEEDRVNCPFYFKIGACRHGDRCSRLHNKPVFSQTILIKHMYQNPLANIIANHGDPNSVDRKETEAQFEDFYEEIYEELCTFGKVEELHVCDNLGEHLLGNVYAKYKDEEHAAAAQKALYGRFYAGRPLICEFSPVTDFREARCRQFDDGSCNRGGYCNFMHVREVPRDLQREFERLYNRYKESRKRRNPSESPTRSRSRSKSRKSRGRSRSRSGSRDRKSTRRSSRKSDSRSRSGSPKKSRKEKSRSRSHSPKKEHA
jgi:splicing factor U2AF subunit